MRRSVSSVGLLIAVLAWSVLAVNLAVVLYGAYVRASRSGDGCGGRTKRANPEGAEAAARSRSGQGAQLQVSNEFPQPQDWRA